MRHHFLLLLLTATTAFTDLRAQSDMWVQSADRFKLATQLEMADADSVVFRNTQVRIFKDGKATTKMYSNLLGLTAQTDSSAALTFQNPGRAIWKPTTSDNSYNNDYYNENSRWNFTRSKESEHFIVFWDKPFGSNPNGSSVPSNLRVDVNDLLQKAEKFFRTNVEKLEMATVGEGKSQLDNYKMGIYLLYQEEWLAVGSGYDDMIGALWVNPSTCKPVGSTIGHEIGHSFQYQVACDYRFNGVSNYTQRGWRYGFGSNGAGGNAFWEQCAQWQSFQDYPSETFGYHVGVWLQNYHRHFNHEWMRYACYWLPYVWTQKHGYPAYGRIWRESRYPEDPLQTYMRLFCDNDIEAFWDEYWRDYAAQLPNYQFDAVHRYATASARNFPMSMNLTADKYWQVAYASCPETSGVNIIQLNLPEAGTQVKADFVGLNPGSALHANDAGKSWNADPAEGDNASKFTAVTTYNSAGLAANRGWRYGFVAIVNDKTVTSDLYSDAEGAATYTIPEGASRLYFVVVGAPTKYGRHEWNERDIDDQQWPYKVRFTGTNRVGYFDFDEDTALKDTTVAITVTANGSSSNYELGTLDLKATGLLQPIVEAFHLQADEIAAAIQPVSAGNTQAPKEGKITFAMKHPTTGAYSCTYTANAGFWCSATGAAQTYGSAVCFVELNAAALTLTYGHMPSQGKGKTYTMRPTFIYMKDGQLHYATIELTLKLT